MKPHIKYFFAKWFKIKNAKPEDAICIDICNELRALVIADKLNGLFFHVENEGSAKRSHQLNMIKKASGKVPGVSDYIFMRGDCSLAIEIKAPKGRQQESQKHFEAWCKDHKIPYYICFSWQDVKKHLQNYGFLFKN